MAKIDFRLTIMCETEEKDDRTIVTGLYPLFHFHKISGQEIAMAHLSVDSLARLMESIDAQEAALWNTKYCRHSTFIAALNSINDQKSGLRERESTSHEEAMEIDDMHRLVRLLLEIGGSYYGILCPYCGKDISSEQRYRDANNLPELQSCCKVCSESPEDHPLESAENEGFEDAESTPEILNNRTKKVNHWCTARNNKSKSLPACRECKRRRNKCTRVYIKDDRAACSKSTEAEEGKYVACAAAAAPTPSPTIPNPVPRVTDFPSSLPAAAEHAYDGQTPTICDECDQISSKRCSGEPAGCTTCRVKFLRCH